MSLQVQTLPMQEDDSADNIGVFPIRELNGVVQFTNGTGSAINDRTFVIDSTGKFSGVVMGGPVANGAVGEMLVQEGVRIQADDLVAAENTFATLGQPVYFKSSTGEFSDTWTAGYYLVGILTTVKDAAGVIEFEKFRYSVLQVTPGSVPPAPGEVGWIKYSVAADATTALSNDFGSNFTILDAFVISDASNAAATIQLLDSSDNAISDAMIAAVATTIVHAATIDGATNGYNVIADGIVKFKANGAADRGTVWMLVQGDA
jgi:hypothetical protein